MVNLKEINEVLKKLKTNKEKLNYLSELLEEIDDKKLREEIKRIIEDLKELEQVAQIETRGKVDWSLPQEEHREERRLERQVVFVPLPEEEKKEENKIQYGLQSNVDLYRGRRADESGIRYENVNMRMDTNEGKTFIDRNDSLIDRRVHEQFTGREVKEQRDESIAEFERYGSSEQSSRGYASLSEEIHEKERKKLRH